MGKRHKGRGSPKGTGQPDPTKDRSDHDAARGKKKLTLQDLAGELPSDDDLRNYTQYIIDESDRGAAVMAASLVERALEDAIRAYTVAPEDGTADTWFQGANAPFRTFAAKIALGRALGIYGEHMDARLGIMKNVRNAFAHRMIPLDFTHPTLTEASLKLSPDPEKHKALPPKVLFAIACIALAKTLGEHAQAKGGKVTVPPFP